MAFKAICLVNGLAGFVNIFYPPVPHISPEAIKSAEKAVGKLSEKSSVEEFAVLQRVLDDKKVEKGEGDDNGYEANVQTVRGFDLRELEKFFLQPGHDPKRTFSGLRRVIHGDNGSVIWTTKEQVEKMRNEHQSHYDIELSLNTPTVTNTNQLLGVTSKMAIQLALTKQVCIHQSTNPPSPIHPSFHLSIIITLYISLEIH